MRPYSRGAAHPDFMIFSSPRFLVFLAAVVAVLAVPSGTRRKSASCSSPRASSTRRGTTAISRCSSSSASSTTTAPRGSRATDDPADAPPVGDVQRRLEPRHPRRTSSTTILRRTTSTACWPVGAAAPAGHPAPAGISFYTFKSMSYTIDVYRREIAPCRSLIDYATFVTFFPELIAGPIVRASIFLPQMTRRIGPTADRLARREPVPPRPDEEDGHRRPARAASSIRLRAAGGLLGIARCGSA